MIALSGSFTDPIQIDFPTLFVYFNKWNPCPFILLVFSVTPFKIDQNKNQNRSIDKVQNLGNERRHIYKDPRQDSGQRNISYTRYPKKCFTQTSRDLYGDAIMLVCSLGWAPTWRTETNRNSYRVLLQKREFILRETHKHKSDTFSYTWTV